MALFEKYRALTRTDSKGYLRGQFGVLIRALVIMGLLTWLIWKIFPGLATQDDDRRDDTILFVAPDADE